MKLLNFKKAYDLDEQFTVHRETCQQKAQELSAASFLDEHAALTRLTECVDAAIQRTVQEVRLSLHRCRENIEEQLHGAQKRMAFLEGTYGKLVEQKASHLSKVEDRTPPWIYISIYVLLLIGMFGTAALTAEMLFAEQGRVLPWLTSFVFIGGSCLINNQYRSLSEGRRPQFLGRLNKIGLVCFVGLALSFAIGRATILMELHQTQSNSFLSAQGQNAKTLMMLQYTTTISAFVFMILLELFFASVVLIQIYERRKPSTDVNAVKQAIGTVEADIETEKQKAFALACELEAIDGFESHQKTWATHTRSILMSDFELKMAQAKEKMFQKLMNMNRGCLARSIGYAQQLPNPDGGNSDAFNQTFSDNGASGDNNHGNDRPF